MTEAAKGLKKRLWDLAEVIKDSLTKGEDIDFAKCDAELTSIEKEVAKAEASSVRVKGPYESYEDCGRTCDYCDSIKVKKIGVSYGKKSTEVTFYCTECEKEFKVLRNF